LTGLPAAGRNDEMLAEEKEQMETMMARIESGEIASLLKV
jgi:hypothetical protein